VLIKELIYLRFLICNYRRNQILMKKFHFTHLFFYFLIAGLVQIPSMSWAQDMVTQPELEPGSRPSFQKLEKNNPGQLKKRPRALQQRRDNRQERRQGVRENRRDNRQDRRQDFRSKRQGGAQKSRGNKGSGGRGRR
jgi:hypothetical protein